MSGFYNRFLDRYRRDIMLKVELPNPNWIKNGHVLNTYKHPVMWGASRYVQSNKYSRDVCEESNLRKMKLRNSMFVVYDEDNMCVQNYTNNSELSKLEVIPIDSNMVVIKCESMPKDLLLDMRYLYFNVKVKCYTTLCNKFVTSETVIDCGNNAASWLCRGLNNGRLRLGFCFPEKNKEVTFWENYKKLSERYSDERDILMNRWEAPIINIISVKSAGSVKCDLDRAEIEKNFHPDIIITSDKPFEEHKWKWMRIGKAVFRNIRPLPKNVDMNDMPVEMKWEMLPTYWEIFSPGNVEVNLNILVHHPSKRDIDSMLEQLPNLK
ncbi:uncharacterized protein LOC105181761 isoform X2 [Harpegnathos saltator]|uniref:Uncharacterized protein n=1 Tax=Harpegnathos saltator TaxID=610380 RepID=E2BE10_HARSA|nr:uncharacterized protein LOC105181761 isoform X2 [Harpegnathos saltator]EFN86074.1 hypothetical protein EAI_03025 [Harpegnathos saltator]